jgi:hypothetical protein
MVQKERAARDGQHRCDRSVTARVEARFFLVLILDLRASTQNSETIDMGKAIFPSMSTADIINSLGAWGVPVAQEQLLRPTPDFVEGVYCACLYQVTSINPDTLRDPAQRILNEAQMVEKVWRSAHLVLSFLTPPKDLHATSLTSHILLYHLCVNLV